MGGSPQQGGKKQLLAAPIPGAWKAEAGEGRGGGEVVGGRGWLQGALDTTSLCCRSVSKELMKKSSQAVSKFQIREENVRKW